MSSLASSMSSLLILFVLMSGEALACRCEVPPASKAYPSADAVVVAKALRVESKNDQTQVVLLSISQAWKKDLPAQLTIDAGGKVCGFFFKEEQEYVVYLKSGANAQYSTRNCVGNKYLNNSQLPAHFAESAKRDIAWLKRHGKPAKQ